MRKNPRMIILMILIVSIGFFFISQSPKQTLEYKSWVWSTQLISNHSQTDKIIEFASNNDIVLINLQISRKISYSDYEYFIESAHKKNIKVYALTGSEKSLYYLDNDILRDFFRFVNDYNISTSKNKFDGIELDVETYNLSTWNDDIVTSITDYQSYINYVMQETHNINLTLDIVMPFWFDKYVTVKGDNFAEWIIKNVDETTIMAYRDTSEKILDVAANEIEYAKQYNKPITIAVEYATEEDKVTFKDEGVVFMKQELQLVYQEIWKNYHDFTLGIHNITELMKEEN